MSVDKREEILVRLLAILETLKTDNTVETVVRNRGLLKNDERPALALLDGSESSTLLGGGRGRVKMSVARVTMRPQIFGLLKAQQPQGKTGTDNIGTQLNVMRGKLIKAIATDAELLALIGPNGDLNYDGMETDLSTERLMDGEFMLNLSISCVMNPY